MDAKKWSAIEAEYISTGISYRDLAKKHKVGLKQLCRYGKANNWVEKRKQFRDKLSAKTAEKTVEKLSEQCSNKLTALCNAADNMSAVLQEASSNPENFRRRIVKTKDATGAEDYEERIFESFDTVAIRQMTVALRDLTAVVRDVYNLPADDGRKDNDSKIELILPKGCEGFDC